MNRTLKSLMLATDIGFILYWLLIGFSLIPKEYLYQDYDNPLLVAWNLSFLPLDLLISGTGLWSMYLYRKGHIKWRPWCLVSLVLTFCSGLQAIAFWSIRLDFDLFWWLPNLFLMLYPLFFLPRLIGSGRSVTGKETVAL
ncbi:YvaD family protein [Paenibacillus sp. FSL W8-0919]|uniref:YvaD family protein n=1 Tax=Paenibacillus sp. FSL W8-0919 TaxID=2954707 RepID=UPI0030F5538A